MARMRTAGVPDSQSAHRKVVSWDVLRRALMPLTWVMCLQQSNPRSQDSVGLIRDPSLVTRDGPAGLNHVGCVPHGKREYPE